MCESDSYGSLYYPTDLLLKNHEEYEKNKRDDDNNCIIKGLI